MESTDKIKVALALLLVAAGVTGFYLLPATSVVLRPFSVVAGVVAGFGVLWFSQLGQEFVGYARDSVKEAQKVVWPNKKETWQTTGVVFLFVGVLALFMWLVDTGLAWLFYDVVLGRG